MKRLFLSLLVTLSPGTVLAQVDPQASIEAKILYSKLYNLSRDFSGKIAYGHQNAFLEGRGWSVGSSAEYATTFHNQLPQSDLAKVIGKNPALTGFDLSSIGDWNESMIVSQMNEIHKRGGFITLSWHIPNFKEDGSETDAWDTKGDTLRKILYQPSMRLMFYKKLDRLVSFLKKVDHLPIIFRPLHEHNYSWFWWGANSGTPFEYVALWKLISRQLQNNGIHNLLYAYSPNFVNGDYFERYPGDDEVDIFGVDQYFKDIAYNTWGMGLSALAEWKGDVITLLKASEQHNKIPAITEFGNEGINYSNFWTDYFSWPIEKDGILQYSALNHIDPPKVKPAYIMLWRNDRNDPKHFFSPFPNQEQNLNFLVLQQKNLYLYLEDLSPNPLE